MVKREYCPYKDANMMKRQSERKATVKDNSERRSGYMSAKQLRDLESTNEEGTLGEGIPILKISKEEKERMIKNQRGVGINFHDPYGFTDGFRAG